MRLRFEDKALELLFTDPKTTGRYPQGVVKAFRDLVQLAQDADDERDFYRMKSLHYEKYERDNHSMRLNDQFRLVVRLEGEGPDKIMLILRIQDYH